MGRVKLAGSGRNYPMINSERPEDALKRALQEVRAERRERSETLLRLSVRS